MPSLDDLRTALVELKIVSADQWDQAVRHAGNAEGLSGLLSALEATSPWWWDHKPPIPPGLTEFQIDAIQTRFADDKLRRLRRDLVLNQFLLLDHLGEGGQGRVYRGRQLRPSRDVAIKILTQDNEDRRKRFEQEARAMIQINHPNVARCFLYERVREESGEVTDDYLIALEYIDGTDIQRMVRRNGPVPWQFGVYWTAQVLEGLKRVHEGGFIHRDVKPENIMIVGPVPDAGVTPEETAAKLLDLGAAKPVGTVGGDGITRAGIFVGTPEYAPPEQWNQGGEPNPMSDVYALAGTLHFMLTGRSPYQKAVRDPYAYLTSHVNDPVPDMRTHAPEVPAEVNRVFQRMMAKDSADRGEPVALAAELRELLARARPPAPSRADARGRRTPTTPPASDSHPVAARKREREPHEASLLDPVLGLLERIFLPIDQRDATSGLSTGERFAVVLRRPFVILLVIVFVLVTIRFCIW